MLSLMEFFRVSFDFKMADVWEKYSYRRVQIFKIDWFLPDLKTLIYQAVKLKFSKM